MRKFIFMGLGLFVFCCASLAQEKKQEKKVDWRESFSEAKKQLLSLYFRLSSSPQTLYCSCFFDQQKKIDHSSCGYQPRNPKSSRAFQLEWEHIVPASVFGRTFAAWTEGDRACRTKEGHRYKGRRCAEYVSQEYRLMQADLYNLFPSIGEVNNLRGDLSFGIVPGERREFGRCDFELEKGVVEVREGIRGDIARAYFYMHAAYPQRVPISLPYRELLEKWHREDPVDSPECERAKEIEAYQKNENPFIKEECFKQGLW